MSVTQISEAQVFRGVLRRYEHFSKALGNIVMKFAVFTPELTPPRPIPSVYYLSGLTCTDENVCQKGTVGFRAASELGMAIIMPDTSPRGHPPIPCEHESWDFGVGAGFYLNATKSEWAKHYRMYDYVVKELPEVCAGAFAWYDTNRVGITGHSMGGHGAMICALKNPGLYRSVSAFCPITNPTKCPWGEKAFFGYLVDGVDEGKQYDTCELLKSGLKFPNNKILVDQGTSDSFYSKTNQLMPAALQEACKEQGVELELNYREGFDHSYYFVSTFLENHLIYHKKFLQ